MDEGERDRFEGAYLSIRYYQEAETRALPVWLAMKSWFAAHHNYTAADMVAGEEKLRAFEAQVGIMEHLGDQVKDGLRDAIGN
jgi:hypothetical protein